MPTDLSNLELDEVSLVDKAANGKKFLIYKSLQTTKGSMMMRDQLPAGAKTRARGAQVMVSKADLEDIVRKAVAPIAAENKRLSGIVEKQADRLKEKEYVAIAKSDFSQLGTPEEFATILKSLETLPTESRKAIIIALKKADVTKAESMRFLGSTLGVSAVAAPGSAIAQFNTLVDGRMGEIRKSAGDKAPRDQRILKAKAQDEISREQPELALAVLREQRENANRIQMGAV